MIVFAVGESLSPDFPLGADLEISVLREDAGRFIEEVRGDDPELASYLLIEERELEAGGALRRLWTFDLECDRIASN